MKRPTEEEDEKKKSVEAYIKKNEGDNNRVNRQIQMYTQNTCVMTRRKKIRRREKYNSRLNNKYISIYIWKWHCFFRFLHSVVVVGVSLCLCLGYFLALNGMEDIFRKCFRFIGLRYIQNELWSI